jgi:hypothetical protein
MNLDQRAQAILDLSKFTGMDLTSHFLRETRTHFPQADIPRIHNLAEGIYKPASDKYAFCIWSRSAIGHDQEIYHDVFLPQEDGSWIMRYAAKSGPLDSAINSSLFACMEDKVPLLVIVTSSPKESPGGARYRMLGPAMIENFEPSDRRFLIRGCSHLIASQLLRTDNDVEKFDFMIRSQIIMPFQVRETRNEYMTKHEAREKAFRQIILEEYKYLCAVCQSKFFLEGYEIEPIVEAEAAHIIPVKALGPDDPRNGMSLCRRHHWSFDKGLFTINEHKEVKVSPSVLQAERLKYDLEEYEGNPIISPTHGIYQPHDEALNWHLQNVFKSR